MKGKTRKLLPSSLEAWRVTAACHINCALKSGRFIVYMRGTKRAAECFHDTRTDEWRACTRWMRADGVHLRQPLEKSLSRAVPLAASARPVVFIFLAYSCKPSLTAFKQMWHQMDGNHNSFGPQILKRHPNRHFLHSYRGVRCYSSTWNIWKASTGAWGHMEMLLLARRPTHTLFPLFHIQTTKIICEESICLSTCILIRSPENTLWLQLSEGPDTSGKRVAGGLKAHLCAKIDTSVFTAHVHPCILHVGSDVKRYNR